MRIVLAEKERMFREMLRRACIERARHEVVGEASDGEETVRIVSEQQPNLLLVDVDLPRLDGFGVAEVVRRVSRSTSIVALTASCASYTLFRIEHCQFEGYIDKGSNGIEALHHLLAEAENGRRYFAPVFHDVKAERVRDPRAFDKVLSDREQQVLGLIGRSLSDDEIGAQLGIAARTVETFRHRILQKLGVAGTPKLIHFALENGFTPISAVQTRPPAHSAPGVRVRRL
ncbi:MAG TPA: response regulator transcription factor [Candidatus Didemnitutus sp.]|nr:response regulator transcription factor [Candidatus Didemnitutus sp.]